MRFAFLTAALIVAGQGASARLFVPRQNFLSSLVSVFGGGGNDDDNTTTTRPPRPTSQTPATTTRQASTTSSPSRSSSSPRSTSVVTTTSTNTQTSTSTDTSTITSSASLTTSSTSTTTATSTAVPINPPVPPTNATRPSSGVPPAGIAVAVIFSIVIVVLIAWLIFRYHPKCRAWWEARQEEKYKKRSYRDALDGPTSGQSGLTRGRVGLQSFFAPRTAKLGDGTEIKRKTINWGAPSPRVGSPDVEDGRNQGNTHHQHQQMDQSFPTPPLPAAYANQTINRSYSNSNNSGHFDNYDASSEKVPLTDLASPMGMQPNHLTNQPRGGNINTNDNAINSPNQISNPQTSNMTPRSQPQFPNHNAGISPLMRNATPQPYPNGQSPTMSSTMSPMMSPTMSPTSPTSAISPISTMSPMSPISPNPIISTATAMIGRKMTATTAMQTKQTKPLPRVKADGQVVYELE